VLDALMKLQEKISKTPVIENLTIMNLKKEKEAA
jgi:hypothetical protein